MLELLRVPSLATIPILHHSSIPRSISMLKIVSVGDIFSIIRIAEVI